MMWKGIILVIDSDQVEIFKKSTSRLSLWNCRKNKENSKAVRFIYFFLSSFQEAECIRIPLFQEQQQEKSEDKKLQNQCGDSK